MVGRVDHLVKLVVGQRHLQLGPEVACYGLIVQNEQDRRHEARAEANENGASRGTAFDKRS